MLAPAGGALATGPRGAPAKDNVSGGAGETSRGSDGLGNGVLLLLLLFELVWLLSGLLLLLF